MFVLCDGDVKHIAILTKLWRKPMGKLQRTLMTLRVDINQSMSLRVDINGSRRLLIVDEISNVIDPYMQSAISSPQYGFKLNAT